ncbi:Toluene-4-monooxygenase system protein E (fragment) (plasmid) [Cupriavidus taiwanensis]
MEEVVLRGLGEAARHNGDTLLGLLTDAQLADAQRHRRWAGALVRMALETPGNRDVLAGSISRWAGLADDAIAAYGAALPDAPNTKARACAAVRDFWDIIGLAGL